MDAFHDPANVQAYAALTADAVNETLYEPLLANVRSGTELLELGMGPGFDLARLSETYQVTGSDRSPAFVNFVRQTQPHANVMVLDARTLQIERRFGAIFSNKVLPYLNEEELRQSFHRQAELLEPTGTALHTFWHGEGSELELDLRVYRRTLQTLEHCLSKRWEVIAHSVYNELQTNDSFWVLLQRNDLVSMID